MPQSPNRAIAGGCSLFYPALGSTVHCTVTLLYAARCCTVVVALRYTGGSLYRGLHTACRCTLVISRLYATGCCTLVNALLCASSSLYTGLHVARCTLAYAGGHGIVYCQLLGLGSRIALRRCTLASWLVRCALVYAGDRVLIYCQLLFWQSRRPSTLYAGWLAYAAGPSSVYTAGCCT